MRLSTKYILFVVLVHLITLGLTWFIFDDNKLFFIAAEAVVIVSLVISWRLYRQLVMPLKYLMQGVEAIKDRDFNVKFLPTGKHEVDQLVDVYNQMIDELRTERTRQEQQHFFLEKLIHTSPTGILILDYDNRVEHLNPRALQIFAVDEKEVQGQLITDLPQPLFKHITELMVGESVVAKPDGMNTYKLQKAHFIDRGFARQFIMIEELTAEILAAEKSTYGKVIRMMAHEVNNTIGPVNSIINSALNNDKVWESHQFNNLKDALQVAADRNQNLNLFMRNFAELVKLPAPKKHNIDLHKLLRSVVSLMTLKAADKGVAIYLNLQGDQLMIRADEQLMEQVLINIIKNSIEAINHVTGVIHISADKNTLTIIDNGPGISNADSANLFSPFYSTKKDGQGIGLTVVRQILTDHGFEFSLNTAGETTAFVIGFK